MTKSRVTKSNLRSRGVTLIEMSLVIMVMLALIGGFFLTTGNIGDWQRAKDASLTLQQVETAQRQFLADNPQRSVASLTDAEVVGYMDGFAALPEMEDLNGNTITIDVTKSPPVWVDSGGDVYDPSGSTSDSLWDVGK